MAYEDLLKSVEESAEELQRELQKRAASATEEIRERAKRRAEEVREISVNEAKKSISTERNKLLFLTKAENKELLIKAREEVFEKTFLEAEDRLSTLRQDPKYPVIFEKLLREAVGTFVNERIFVHVDKQDEDLCKKTLDALNLRGEIHPDLQTRGGVAVSSSGNAVMITNTVESRLLRVRESRRQDIHAILAG